MASRPLISKINGEDRNQADLEFRKLADVLRQYLYAYGADGTPLYVSDGLLDYFGFTMEDFRAGDFKTRASFVQRRNGSFSNWLMPSLST